MSRAAVAVFVLDSSVWKLHVPVFVRQFVLARPPRDLLGLAIRPTIAVLLASIAFVEEALVVALELVVQDHALHPSALVAQALLSPLVGAIDLRIVRELARLPEAGVERLAGFPCAVAVLVAIGFKEIFPTVGQHDGAVICAERRSPNQTLFFEMPEILACLSRLVPCVVQIAFRHDSKCANCAEHAAF